MPRSITSINDKPQTSQLRQQKQKTYLCPGCKLPYDFNRGHNQKVLSPRFPLVLNCSDTICYDCCLKSYANHGVTCKICQTHSPVKRNELDKLNEVFSPNFYILGYLFWTKQLQSVKLEDSFFSMVPIQVTLKNKKRNVPVVVEEEQCCLVSCQRRATMRCPECSHDYCHDCCLNFHQSVKSMWSHQPTNIPDLHFNIELDKCTAHNGMKIDMFCNTCDLSACCYCFLEKHEGHDRKYLSKLNDLENAEMQTLKADTEKVLKHLLNSQKKIRNLSTPSKSSKIEIEISQYFSYLHGKLHSIESNLLDQTSKFTSAAGSNLDKISTKINQRITRIRQLHQYANSTEKINLQKVFNQLKEVVNIPCCLVNKSIIDEPIHFHANDSLDRLEDMFEIEHGSEPEFCLVKISELPDNFECDEDVSDSESIQSKIKTSNVNSSFSSVEDLVVPPKRKQRSEQNIWCEKVSVTHIVSLERFYVQLEKRKHTLDKLIKRIENYMKSNPDVIKNPKLHEIYLCLYQSETERQWCRVRVIGVVPSASEDVSDLYEVFLIDYGSSQTVPKDRLHTISHSILTMKPIAMECQLYNPTYIHWSKTAHVYLGKIIQGKNMFMSVKSQQRGIFVVDLLVSSSDGGLTSIVDILVNTCQNALSSSEDNVEAIINTKKDNYSVDVKVFENSRKFHVNQKEEVVIASIVDPQNIHIHIAAFVDALKKLSGTLKRHYRTSQAGRFIPLPETYVVVEYKDQVRGNYHRGYIKQVYSEKERVLVLLVDWGIEAEIPWAKIRILTSELTKLEAQAIRIGLADITPPDGEENWSEQSIAILEKYYRIQDNLKMIVHNLDPLEVVLLEMCGNVDICINTLLVQEKQALSTGRNSTVLEWPHNTMNPTSISADAAYHDGLIASMLLKIDEDSAEEDEDQISNSVTKEAVNIVKINDPGEIYIKLHRNKQLEQTLHSELQIHYMQIEPVIKDSWQKEDDCVVYQVDRNEYARGIIQSEIESDDPTKELKYLIYLYDKAVELVVSSKKMFECNEYFQGYPKMVVRCYLAGIQPAGDKGNWANTATELLHHICDKYQNIFVTKIKKLNDADSVKKTMAVEMWYQKFTDGDALQPPKIQYVSMNSLLVKVGLAFRDHSFKIVEEIAKKKTVTKKVVKKEDIEAIEDWLPAFKLTDKEFDAYITCAESEGILYLHSDKLEVPYKQMEEYMKKHFDEIAKTKLNEQTHWSEGDLCTIFYEDYWYRGKILKVINPTEISVIMIDFGSEHFCHPKDLYKKLMYVNLEAFATKVQLYDLTGRCGKWLDSDYDILMTVIKEQARVVVKSDLNDDVPLVEVYSLNSNKSVNDELADLCPNLVRKNKSSLWCDDEETLDDDSVVIEDDFKIDFGILKNDKLMTITSVIDYETVVIMPSGQSEAFRGELLRITSQMQAEAELQPSLEKSKWTIGQACLAPYSEEGTWYYRARIHNVDALESGHVFVLYVDFGNIDSVPCDQLREIRNDWLRLPIQCFVANINFKLTSKKYSRHVMQKMRKFEGKEKIVRFVQIEPLIVEFYNLGSVDGGKKRNLSYQYLIKDRLVTIPDVETN